MTEKSFRVLDDTLFRLLPETFNVSDFLAVHARDDSLKPLDSADGLFKLLIEWVCSSDDVDRSGASTHFVKAKKAYAAGRRG